MCQQGHASPGNVFCHVQSLMWGAKWLRRMHPAHMHGVRGGDWVQKEESVLMNKGFTPAGQIPSWAKRITWIPVQWVGETTERVDGFTGSVGIEPQDKELPLGFLFILFLQLSHSNN